MNTLTLPLRRQYFDEIRAGIKVEEFRLANPYWTKRLVGRTYDKIVLTLGYPAAGDAERRIIRPWRGFVRRTITHPHFGPDPVEVFAIDVAPLPAVGSLDGFPHTDPAQRGFVPQ